MWWQYLILIVGGYLLGSFNSSIVLSRILIHDDIRNHGSGNAGMTNAFRVMGKKGGLLVILGDVGKVVIACLAGRLLLGQDGVIVATLAAILGHCFPLYFGFKGGKGILETVAAMAVLDWRVAAICFSIFLIVLFFSKMVSLSSIVAAISLPITFLLLVRPIVPWHAAAIALIAAFLIFQHRSNIGRIRDGTESRVHY